MYKLTYSIKDEIFGYKTEHNWYNIHAVCNKEDIIIASIEDIPCNHDFLTWLDIALKVEEKKTPHLTANDVAELIKLFQEYLEAPEDEPIYPYIYRFSKICMFH